MNQEFNMRLKEAMNIRAITQSELCEKTGIPKSAMSQYISGNFKPKQNRTHSLAKALNVNEAWLMGYDVPLERSDYNISHDDHINNLINKYPEIHQITKKSYPLLANAPCGEPIYEEVQQNYYVSADADINADFCVKAKGDSMINAKIFDGDIVFIKSQPEVENGQIALISIDDEVTIKRFYKNVEEVILVPDNPTYKTIRINNESKKNIRILGLAVANMSLL